MTSARQSISVALVDDQEVVRYGFRSILEGVDDISVVGEAESASGALTMAATAQPDILLLEAELGGDDGIGLCEELLKLNSRAPKVVIITSHRLDEHLFRALQAGASGFLLKSVRSHDLVSALRDVISGGIVISPLMTRQLVDRFSILPPAEGKYFRTTLSVLSDRELQVLRLVGLGKANLEIASEMHLTIATVKSHVSHILTKLRLRDRVGAALLAHEAGLVGFPRQAHVASAPG